MATPEIPKEKQAEFEKFKKEGYMNPDGSYYDPDSGLFNTGKPDGNGIVKIIKVRSPEDAFAYRKEGYKPFIDVAKKEAADKAAKAKGEVTNVTQEAVTKQRTVVELDAFKTGMMGNFAEVMNALQIDKQKVTGTFTFDKTADLGFQKEGIKAQLEGKFAGKNMTAVAKIVNDTLSKEPNYQPLKNEEVRSALIDLYSSAAVTSLKSQFKTMYPGGEDFIKEAEEGKSYDFSYELIIMKNASTFATVFKPADADWVKDYKEYETKHPRLVVLSSTDKNLYERASAFKGSGVGRFLGAIGIIDVGKGPEGETEEQRGFREDKAYAEALNGHNIFAQIFIYFAGGAAMLQDGGASVRETIAGLDPKFQPLVKAFESKTPKLLSKLAEDPKFRAPEDVIEAARTEVVDQSKFDEMVKDPTKIPEDKYLKLNGEMKADGLTIVLPEGSEMILPIKGHARISEKGAASADKGSDTEAKHLKGTFSVVGTLPKDTLFKGKVQFKPAGQTVVDEKKDAAKPDAAKSEAVEKPAA